MVLPAGSGERRRPSHGLPAGFAGLDRYQRRFAGAQRRICRGGSRSASQPRPLEREYVRAIVGSVNGNKREAAAILQIDRETLYRKLEEPEPAEPSPLDKADRADKAEKTG